MLQQFQSEEDLNIVKSFYGDDFPFEVRGLRSIWIEQEIEAETSVDVDDPRYSAQANDFIENLIGQLENERQRIVQQWGFTYPWIDEAINRFKQNDPLEIYKQIRTALSHEKYLLYSGMLLAQMKKDDNSEIDERLRKLREILTDLDNNQYPTILCIKNIRETFHILNKIKEIVVDELSKWKREQALAANGAPFAMNAIDEIQKWFEESAYLISLALEVINKVFGVITADEERSEFIEMFGKFNGLYESLITSGFVIAKQPSQVLRISTNFEATLRHLLPSAFLSSDVGDCSVSVSILSEKHAKSLTQRSSISTERSGDIENSAGTFRFDESTNTVVCELPELRLTEIVRTKRPDYAMREKFTFLFQTRCRFGDKYIEAWTISLPVIVVAESNQVASAWGTVLWDNSFSEIGRTPDAVPWPKLANALQLKFQSTTGCNLTEENLQHLCEKIYRAKSGFNPKDQLVTFAQFGADPLPSCNFTFWEWFYAATKLIGDHLTELWQKGHIHGFISKEVSEELLSKCESGTFLLRFADSMLAGISISCVQCDGGKHVKIARLSPYTHKDFLITPLSSRVNDLRQCVTLYPNTRKNEAFGVPSQVERPAGGGYISIIH